MELSEEDKQRIEKKAYDIFYHDSPIIKKLIAIAEYATIYEREQQAKEQKQTVCAMCGGTGIIGNGPTSFNQQPCSCQSKLKTENMYSEELANKVRQIISDIRINKANLKHIAEHGKINGSLHASLYDIIYKYEAERSELKLALNIATNPGRPNHDAELRNKVIEEAIEQLNSPLLNFSDGLIYKGTVIELLNSLKK